MSFLSVLLINKHGHIHVALNNATSFRKYRLQATEQVL